MATLLLFNIHDEAKRTAIRLLSLRLGFTVLDVMPEQQDMKISELLCGASHNGCSQIPFTDEMMVMSDFCSHDMHALIDGMRNNGSPVRLKCIVTETNRSWTASRLHRELTAEAEAIRRRTSRR